MSQKLRAGRPRCNIAGIGIDLERRRNVRLEAGRFFLTGSEMQWLTSLPELEQGCQLLRIWTIKEALFKSNPENKQTALSDYTLKDPAAWNGWACLGNDFVFHYFCYSVQSGFLSIAILQRGN